jgi:tetratricopeptide (TPR) repeat protein
VLDGSPQHLEASQALGDLYTRMEQPDRAAVYYGHLFDLLIDPKDETKALAIYNRFLRNTLAIQSPERITRYAFLLQKQNRGEEAIEPYTKAAEVFSEAGRGEDALFCWAHGATGPDKLAAANEIGGNRGGGRTRWRLGVSADPRNFRPPPAAPVEALKLLARAYELAPQERRGAAVRRGQASEWERGGCRIGEAIRAQRKWCGVSRYVRRCTVAVRTTGSFPNNS